MNFKRWRRLKRIKKIRSVRDLIIKTTNLGRAKHLLLSFPNVIKTTINEGLSDSVSVRLDTGHEFYKRGYHCIELVRDISQEVMLFLCYEVLED